MRERGFAALEAAGMVLTALAFPALIHGLLAPDFTLPRTLFGWVPGGTATRTTALAAVALLAATTGGWAHTRRTTAAVRKTADRETAGWKTAGWKTAGWKTADRKTAGREATDRETTSRTPTEPSAVHRADETGGGP
ncbi:hypothetical protein ACIQPQ_24075 [Streptomyces sp. NPDC091281]|uniref:hypothetical protein n=1 Tax=Streptomyces sp. NPDC091281 TaxID=3365985 RepID=UPI00380ED075